MVLVMLVVMLAAADRTNDDGGLSIYNLRYLFIYGTDIKLVHSHHQNDPLVSVVYI